MPRILPIWIRIQTGRIRVGSGSSKPRIRVGSGSYPVGSGSYPDPTRILMHVLVCMTGELHDFRFNEHIQIGEHYNSHVPSILACI